MNKLKMVVWDVGLGNSIVVETPDHKHALFDAGVNMGTHFSPARYMYQEFDVQSLDYFSVSHPHVDHIQDILNVDKYLSPKVFSRNRTITKEKVIEENKEVLEKHKDIIEKYFDMDSRYNAPLPNGDRPSDSSWGGGARIIYYSNHDLNMNLNDLSSLKFVEYASIAVCYPGDLEEKGWANLLKRSHFTDWLEETKIFIASHHGRESGYCKDIFEYLSPDLTIISDGRFGDTSATPRYSSHTAGLTVTNLGTGKKEKRKVLTTRNDGVISVDIYESGEIDAKFHRR